MNRHPSHAALFFPLPPCRDESDNVITPPAAAESAPPPSEGARETVPHGRALAAFPTREGGFRTYRASFQWGGTGLRVLLSDNIITPAAASRAAPPLSLAIAGIRFAF